jgi:adenylate cyclase
MFGQKNIFEEALALYAGAHVVERIKKQKHSALQRFSEEVQLTLLVQDLKPFTTFNEKLSREKLGQIQGDYMDGMSGCITDHGGVIDHFRGDSVVAYWGPPEGDRVVAAVKRAKEIGQELTEKWREVLPGEMVPQHGIHAGRVLRGNFGAKNRLAYSIMGNEVNLTFRLCSSNSCYKTQSLCTGGFRILLSNPAELNFADDLVIKGRSEKVALYTLEQAVRPQP